MLRCIVELFKLKRFDRVLKLLNNFIATYFLACRAAICIVIARIYHVIRVVALLESSWNPHVLLVGIFREAGIFEKDIEGAIIEDNHKFV